MYKVQSNPDEEIVLNNGVLAHPVVTLKDEYGGVAHITKDDHCYVLVLWIEQRNCVSVTHWFAEAVDALKDLPTPT